MKYMARSWTIPLLVIALGIFLRLAIFGISCLRIPAFDDECKIAIQAKQIVQGERPLLILASPYIFPLDAYIMAPFINSLPKNAFGARILAWLCSIISMLLSLAIVRRMGAWRVCWPGFVLIAFGSAYLMLLQNGCALPGYATLVMLSALAVWIAQRFHNDTSSKALWVAPLSAGIIIGLACSETMLCLPVLIMVGLMLGIRQTIRGSLAATISYAVGVTIGLLPHIAASYIYGNAFHAVQQSVSFRAGIAKLISPAMTITLPSSFGIGCPLFPDTRERVLALSGMSIMFSVVWSLVMIAASGIAVVELWRRWKTNRSIAIDTGMAFVGISWMCLVLFLFSGRSHYHTYRYMVPLVWSFPFVITMLYRRASYQGRILLGSLTGILVAVNVGMVVAVLNRWADRGIADHFKAYDLKPAIAHLTKLGITRGYATYVDAYRFTYETDGRIILCQPYNERFPGWKVPFKEDIVDPCTNIAYVLSDSYRFTPERFERDLRDTGILYTKTNCGAFSIFTGFHSPGRWEAGVVLDASLLDAKASHNPADADNMVDRSPAFWRCSGYLQQTGMWVSVEWASPKWISSMRIDHGHSGSDHAELLTLYSRSTTNWTLVASGIPDSPDPFEFRNQHPIYGRSISIVSLPAALLTSGIKIEIEKPRLRYAWTISEISVVMADDE